MTVAQDLDRRITFRRWVAGEPNEFNEVTEAWVDLATVWAKRRDVSDSEKFAAGQVGAALQTRFTVRSSTLTRTVTAADQIVHAERVWNIIGVKEADEGRNRFIEITAVADSA